MSRNMSARWVGVVLLGALPAMGCKSEFYWGPGGELHPAPTLETASVLYVDDDNATGTEDGTAVHPYRTVAAALARAGRQRSDVLVAAGEYPGNLRTEGARLSLLGGFEGGSKEDYAQGRGGRFTGSDPRVSVTRLRGAGDDAVVTFLDAHGSKLDGFVVTGGTGHFDGDRYEGGGIHLEGGSASVTHNVIEGNDIRHGDEMARGGGLSVDQCDAVIEDNVIRDNFAMRGAGISVGNAELVVIRRNVVENNTAIDDHGGGLFLQGTHLELTENVIRGNVIGRHRGADFWGWGGGVYLHTKGTVAYMTGNVITDNFSPSLGSGVFVDNEAQAYLKNELYYRNRCNDGGVALYVDGLDDTGLTGSHVWVDSSTIADHECATAGGGNAVLAVGDSTVQIVNSILWNNGSRARFYLGQKVSENLSDMSIDDSKSHIEVAYSLVQSPSVWREEADDVWKEEPILGHGNIFVDPLFANPAAGDFHLRSSAGRWDPTASEGRGAWVKDAASSPAIDRGDPEANVQREPAASATRRDLGCYGGTTQASLATEAL